MHSIQKMSSKKTKSRTKNTKECAKVSDDVRKRLASLVEQNVAIWQLSHPKYSNRDFKEAAWRKIAIEMDMTGISM